MAKSSKAASGDPWREIEDAALKAFEGTANLRAPGLVAVLRRSVRYARVDNDLRQILIERSAFFYGLLAVGALDKPSKSFGNTATWVTAFIMDQGGSDLTQFIQSQLTGTDEIITAFRDGCSVVATPKMEAVAIRAKAIAVTTIHRNLAELRHFFTAFVEDGTSSLQEFAQTGWRVGSAELSLLKKTLFERINANPENGEDMQAWESLLLQDSGGGGVESPREEVAGFASDRAGVPFEITDRDLLSNNLDDPNRDPLMLMADVRAFARLICLEEAEPPLSIGVFGGWGSGKSTFMQLLEAAVTKLAKTQKDKAANAVSDNGGQKGPRFISNVVQVRFNAWHFADANLWASLTAEFFAQLRAGGYAGSGKAIHRRLVERVNDHVHALTSEAVNARKALLESEKVLQKKQKARDTAAAKVQSGERKAIAQTLTDALTKSFNEHKADLTEMGRRTYYDNPSKDIETFIEVVKQVQSFWGQVAAIYGYIAARGSRITIAVASVLVFLVATWWIWPSDNTEGAYQFNALGIFAFLAGLGGLSRTILPGVKLVANLTRSTAEFAKELDDATEAGIKSMAKADEAVQRAATEAQARRAAADRADKALARYIDPTSSTSNPPRLLRYMLEDDPDTRALEKEIGLISRVRRLFQAVDEIVAEEKTKSTAIDREGDGPDPDVPDRIVIYIDDLDRCTPSQVYAVLQAVHLLLAFRLFVVVVGVDVNWVEHSLLKEFPPSGSTLGQNQNSLAIRYLEKIFQLPFWIQRLSTKGNDGGSYGRFVRRILKTEKAAGEDGQRNGQPLGSDIEDGLKIVNTGGGEAPAGPESASSMETTVEHKSFLDEALSTVELTEPEVKFLTNEGIGQLAGREPRTVKRFINVYRLIRARLASQERQAFLGDGTEPEQYPVVVVLVAIETGLSSDVVAAFYESMTQSKESDLAADGNKLIAAAFNAASVHRGNRAVSPAECLRWAGLVRRYSFNGEP
ncbi:hypothetical protein QO004_005036 [Rhizobium mesoamericanum]|uniref:P-loop NTPase fold protein n=1 Tax=Rhizobium mesoamericanum TaxID=1079800 RepID=UPI002782E641|nr:P-loop NTPase fold protein [Rhizobium mesoamericanum]MDQ0563227.1 hypothetical protein [Rhizobium mesoamericanum]